MPEKMKARTTGEHVMVCDCYRAGPDWNACDLPVVPLLCDGECTKQVVSADKRKRKEYEKYLKEGGKRWSRETKPFKSAEGWQP